MHLFTPISVSAAGHMPMKLHPIELTHLLCLVLTRSRHLTVISALLVHVRPSQSVCEGQVRQAMPSAEHGYPPVNR